MSLESIESRLFGHLDTIIIVDQGLPPPKYQSQQYYQLLKSYLDELLTTKNLSLYIRQNIKEYLADSPTEEEVREFGKKYTRIGGDRLLKFHQTEKLALETILNSSEEELIQLIENLKNRKIYYRPI